MVESLCMGQKDQLPLRHLRHEDTQSKLTVNAPRL